MAELFSSANELILAAIAVAFVLNAATFAAMRSGKIDGDTGAYLIGSLVGTPIFFYRVVQSFGTGDGGISSLVGSILQFALAWLGAALPFGALGLFLWRIGIEKRATGIPNKRGSKATIIFMTCVGGIVWAIAIWFSVKR